MSTLEAALGTDIPKRAGARSKLSKANLAAGAGAALLVGGVAGSIVWGIKFAFAIALVLAPVMLVIVAVLARANSLAD